MKELVLEIRSIIDNARANAVRSVDFCRVQMYEKVSKEWEEGNGSNQK